MPEVNAPANTPSRRQKAAGTRRAILVAAHSEFSERGYAGATMSAIARRAGVAPQTVQFVFHTKGELLGGVVARAVLGEEEDTPPERSDWFAALKAETDPRNVLTALVRSSGEILRRASDINEVARQAALVDEDAAAAFARLENLRAASYREVVAVVDGGHRGILQHDVDTSIDILVTTLSPRTYLTLTSDRSWTHEKAIDWLADAIPALLLSVAPPTSDA